MTKGYEILFIIKANLGEEEILKITDQFKSWLEKNEGNIHLFNNLGKREIATPIKHDTHGIYIQCQFSGTAKTLKVLENNFKVSETILRHLIVTLDSIMTEKEIDTLCTKSGEAA